MAGGYKKAVVRAGPDRPSARSAADGDAAEAARLSSPRPGSAGHAPAGHAALKQQWRAAPRRRRAAGAAEAATRLLTFADLPPHLRDNQSIKAFYRPVVDSKRAALRTLFAWHNESGSIWSHAAGFLLFGCLALCALFVWAPSPLAAHRLHGLIALHKAQGAVGRAEHAAAAALAGAAAKLAAALKAHGGGGGAGGGRVPAPLPPSTTPLSSPPPPPPPALAAALKHAEAALASSRTGSSGGAAAAPAASAARRAAGALGRELAALEHALARAARSARAGAAAEVAALEAAASRAARAALGAAWPAPRWPLLVFFGGAMACLGASATCHLLGCLPEAAATAVWRFDYAGIVALIVTSFFPPVVYGFACEAGPRVFYLASTSALGLATLWVTLDTSFQAPRYRPFRAGLFSVLGMWGVFPATHALLLHWGEPAHMRAFAHYVAMGGLYLAGAAIFASRVPERWAPGRFDLVGNSHQLFHVFIVLAAVVHCRGVLGMMHWRDSVGGCHV